ncbi:MAG: ABC transporter ATP-binding protein [Actinomycetota bacterium]|nr:ABC transporter ATP-binding protein [Actinomycetota bacterium]
MSSLTHTAVLRAEHVQLGYWAPEGFTLAVRDATFSVALREKTIVIGPSGCGKSTLLKAVAGFIRPTAGRIQVAGREKLEPGPDRAVVFQEFDQLFPWRTVLDNVAYPLRINGWKRRDAVERAREFVELTSLGDAADRYPHQLSGGMKQRVAIARALALDPAMLLMDEPFGSLDMLTRARLQQELNGIIERTQTTLLLVTHSMDEALTVGDKVVVLAGSPSTVTAIVDVRDVGPPDSPRYAETRLHLRDLLAVTHEEGELDVVNH